MYFEYPLRYHYDRLKTTYPRAFQEYHSYTQNTYDAVDEKIKTVQCKKDSKKGCNGKSTKCLTHNLWDELENHINNFFEEKNLEDLVKDNAERRV